MTVQSILERGTEVSRYRVEELVARGGMGLVYRARDVRLDRRVALKVLSPELSDDERFRERFVRESRLAAAVDHPNVIPVFEADDWHGLLYIAMRYVDGVDLHTVLATSGRMEPAVALPLLAQAADALDAAHRLGLVHRDVKPGNFMLAGATADRVPPGTHVYLTDFGLTKRATSVSGLTRTGQFLGSLHYVAPEQIRGEDVDARTDVYALACVAFEMLAGRPPYRLDQDAALLWAHMSVPPPRLTDDRPDLPDELDDVLAQGMAKDRSDRPTDCRELIDSLRDGLAGQPGADRAGTASLTGPARIPTARPPRDGGPPAGAPPPAGGAGETVLHGPAPAGAAPPPGWGGGVPGSGGPGSFPGAPAAGRRRRWWPWVTTAALVAGLVAGLLVWSPWSGPDLVSRDFVVMPFRADVPDDWAAYTVTGDTPYVVFGSRDWTGLAAEDGDVLAEAEAALTEDPESLVHVYVDPAYDVYTSDAKGLAEQVQGGWEGSTLVEQGTREVDGREAFTAGGLAPHGEGQVRVYAVTLQDEPRLFMLFVCPNALYEEWQPVFDQIVNSVTFIG